MSKITYRWLLRERMAERGMFKTTEIIPLLTERGIDLSATQAYRLVTSAPERLSMPILAALCDALACAPNDLIEIDVATAAGHRRAAGGARFMAMLEADPAPHESDDARERES